MSAKTKSPAIGRTRHVVQHDSHVICFERFQRDSRLRAADKSRLPAPDPELFTRKSRAAAPVEGDALDAEPSVPVTDWWDPDRETVDADIVSQILRWWEDGKLWRIRENLRQNERSALAMGRWLFGPRQFMEYLEAMLWAELRWRGWRLAASWPSVGKAEKKILAFDQELNFIGSFRRLESKRLKDNPGLSSIAEFAKTLRKERLLEPRDPSRTPTLAEAFKAPSVWEELTLIRRQYARASGKERRRIEQYLVAFIKAVGTVEGRPLGAIDPVPRRCRKRLSAVQELESNMKAKDALARRASKIEKDERVSRGGLKREFERMSKKSNGRLKPATFRRAYYLKSPRPVPPKK